jgi:hypothetical protein
MANDEVLSEGNLFLQSVVIRRESSPLSAPTLSLIQRVKAWHVSGSSRVQSCVGMAEP